MNIPIDSEMALFTDEKVIRFMGTNSNSSIKSEVKFICNSELCFFEVQFTHYSNPCITVSSREYGSKNQKITLPTRMQIELPVNGEAIHGHLLPEGTIVDGIPLTKPIWGRIDSLIITSVHKVPTVNELTCEIKPGAIYPMLFY